MPRKVDDCEVFTRAHRLTLDVYKLTRRFPKEEVYSLVSQMRRTAYAIPMNLKEGSGGTEAEFFRYVRIALGSREELDYQLRLARDLRYITDDECNRLSTELAEIGRMLYGIIRKSK
jgi:four helix bundle protein